MYKFDFENDSIRIFSARVLGCKVIYSIPHGPFLLSFCFSTISYLYKKSL